MTQITITISETASGRIGSREGVYIPVDSTDGERNYTDRLRVIVRRAISGYKDMRAILAEMREDFREGDPAGALVRDYCDRIEAALGDAGAQEAHP